LLDLPAPDGARAAALRDLRSANPATRVVALVRADDVRAAVVALQLGAVEVFVKPADPNALAARLRQALEEARGASEAMGHARALATRFAGLAERERTALSLVLRGWRSPQIARAMGLSVRQARAVRASAMRTLGVGHLEGLVRACVLAGADLLPKLQD
jgi:two-component system, LuxR family, response regulator FixJ